MNKFGLLLCSVFVIGMMVGCSECPDCPDGPVHVPDYHLIYSFVGPTYPAYVITYSTRTGQIIDSVYFPSHPFDWVDFSADGEFACYTNLYSMVHSRGETWVERTATHDTVAYANSGALLVGLGCEGKFALMSAGNNLTIRSFPNLGLAYEDSSTNYGGCLHPIRRLAYFTYNTSPDTIRVVDFRQDPSDLRSYPMQNRAGELVQGGPMFVSSDGRYLVASALLPFVTSYLLVYGADRLNLIHEIRTRDYDGFCVHPDNRRVFLCHYEPHDFAMTGGIDVYDFKANVLQHYISSEDLDLGNEPFVPSQIQFTPDGETMYVLCGATGFWVGSILEFRTATKEITRRFRHTDGSSRLMRLNPKDWAR